MKSENFEHVDFIKIIFGFSYITDKLENFYLLFLGKSAVIHTFFVSGIFVFLILYQFYKNILIINKKEISQNLILLIYIAAAPEGPALAVTERFLLRIVDVSPKSSFSPIEFSKRPSREYICTIPETMIKIP